MANVMLIIFAVILIPIGWILPLPLYLTPKSGIGYWLGIIGATQMLLLFSYSVKKRFKFSWLEKTPILRKWFNLHILFGIFGPICILYHCAYHMGATNSNVALWSMIIVMVSGFVGRYMYQRIGWEIPFKWWHYAHLPIVGMLVVSAIIHIIAVNLY